ncbi:class F sortase [Streptomyces durbertensis]|uniref:Class F sortase n=1 Tax=Streptomyces durbertensis TaxID=2448886 RepID=A0ABR6EEI5_9ACTN|nr:class F sortase [Streptomyces durbertensis]MBB1243730.1 class F sortase [Streptomyces durbertensis]
MTRTTHPRRLPAVLLLALALAVLLNVAAGGGGSAGPEEFGGSTAARAAAEAPPPAATSPKAESDTAGAPGAPEAARPDPPERLRIDRVGLDAPVVPTGVDEDGAAEVPDDPARAGWYRFGPAPGAERGSAVLLGHVDSRTGELGALVALYEVRAGDEVTVERRHGTPARFEVSARRVVPKDDLPKETFARAGPHVLTLITCAPPYDPGRGGYQNNVIVTAVPVSRD